MSNKMQLRHAASPRAVCAGDQLQRCGDLVFRITCSINEPPPSFPGYRAFMLLILDITSAGEDENDPSPKAFDACS